MYTCWRLGDKGTDEPADAACSEDGVSHIFYRQKQNRYTVSLGLSRPK